MLADTIKLASLALLAVAVFAQLALKAPIGVAAFRQSIADSVAAGQGAGAAPSTSRVVDTHVRDQLAVARTPEEQPLFNEVRLTLNGHGAYATTATINNVMVNAIVDTGANYVALRYEDAKAMGISLSSQDFTGRTQTANGSGRVAPVRLREIQIGPIKIYDVKGFVAERGALGVNLLGMTFLSRLSHTEMVAGGGLVLRQ